MSTEGLEKRIAVLEAIEEIKRLKARYSNVCDTGYDPDQITKLFTKDGVWEGGEFGIATGHAALREMFEGLQKAVSFAQHNAMNPVIEVMGDHAKGTWYLFCPYTSRANNRACWIAGRYEDDYIKVDGEWKFQHLRAIIRMHARYDEGWAKK